MKLKFAPSEATLDRLWPTRASHWHVWTADGWRRAKQLAAHIMGRPTRSFNTSDAIALFKAMGAKVRRFRNRR